jgi:hypothetical protein
MDTPYFYSDGYKAYGNWPSVKFTGLYKNTNHLPFDLKRSRKKCQNVAVFIVSIRREEAIGDKCYFKFSMYYDHSIN